MASAAPKKKAQATSDKQNIKVMVRVRPLNKAETDADVKCIVKCVSNREIMTKDKRFHFDRVFKPETEQIEVYRAVVAPMIPDIISGYNCTVFAYGPTGSGKTYTMTGNSCACVDDWQTDQNAGCVPRAASHIFEELSKLDKNETNVKVSYLELYNEEIRDLLSDDDNILPIFSNTKGMVFIHGLTEITVLDSESLCKQLLKGITKRQTAPTLMNHQSSRSHTVFTIIVHSRETTVAGEEILKTGKINLVDLAGSENIARSGCKDLRAVELANINKSLLTLGRVIQALADKSPKHVPYRDSKLTRILQDSLGGHTKTAIVATISPAANSYDETLSTLDYASRARDIKNTPTVNEKLTKAQMIQGLLTEIEKLQKDLDAARDQSGFYVNKENYDKLIETVELVTGEKLTMEELARRQTAKIKELEDLVKSTIEVFDETMRECQKSKKKLHKTRKALKEKEIDLEQERYLSDSYQSSSGRLHKHCKVLLTKTETLAEEKDLLQDKLEKQYMINVANTSTGRNAVNQVLDLLKKLTVEQDKMKTSDEKVSKLCREDIRDLKIAIENVLEEMRSIIHDFTTSDIEHATVKQQIKLALDKCVETVHLKGSRLKKLMEDNEYAQTEFEKVLLPRLFNKMQKLVGDFITGVYNIAMILDENLDMQDYEMLLEFDELLRNFKSKKDEQELIMKRFLEEQNSTLKHMEKVRQMLDHKKTNRAAELVEQMMSQERILKDGLAAIVEELKAQSLARLEAIPKPSEADEFYKIAVDMRQDILDNLTKSEEEHTVRSAKSLQKLGETVQENHENLNCILQTKVNIVSSRLDFLVDDRDTFEKCVKEITQKSTDILTEGFLKKVVPPKHDGDTPHRKPLDVPKPIDPLPREALIERFIREKGTMEEDKENFSFDVTDLNLSTSFSNSRISESEFELGDSSRTDTNDS